MTGTTTETKSRKELTQAESDFYKLIRLRATQPGIGQPYIANAIFRLIPISAPGLGTMGVDKFWRCYIDFDFMMEKGVEYAAGVLSHEPWHLLRNHNERAELIGADKTPLWWNMAGDLEINDDIINLVPKDSLFPGTGQFADFKVNDIAENYYAKIKEMFPPQEPTCPVHGKSDDSKSGENNSSQNGENGEGSGDQNSNEGQSSQNSQSGNGQGECKCGSGKGEGSGKGNGVPKGNCGSGTEKIKEYEIGEGEADGVDSDEAESIRKQVAEEIRKAELGNPGSTAGNAKLWADEVLAHKPVSWKQVLRGQVKDAIAWKRGHTDYMRKRPARRQPIKDVVFPALRSPKPRIGIAIDTSGSNLGNLGVVIDEIYQITKQVGVRGSDLTAFAVDTRKSGKIQQVSDPKKIDLRGGGGTDMRVAYTELASMKGKIDIGIILTDGETPWPSEAPTNAVKFITLIMVQKDRKWNERIITEAENAVGKWSKIVIVEVD